MSLTSKGTTTVTSQYCDICHRDVRIWPWTPEDLQQKHRQYHESGDCHPEKVQEQADRAKQIKADFWASLSANDRLFLEVLTEAVRAMPDSLDPRETIHEALIARQRMILERLKAAGVLPA